MSAPPDDAFNMEVLDARERATGTGIEIALGGAAAALSILVSLWLMDGGDYATPFLIMAAAHLGSTAIYWKIFRPLEIEEPRTEEEAAGGIGRRNIFRLMPLRPQNSIVWRKISPIPQTATDQ